MRSIRSSPDAYDNDVFDDDENDEQDLKDLEDQEMKKLIRIILMSRHGKSNKMLRDGR